MTYEFSRDPKEVPHFQTDHRAIETPIPAPGTREILERLDRVEANGMHSQLPIVWLDAARHSVWDYGHNQFIDFTSGIFSANVGHANNALSWEIGHASFAHSYTFATEERLKYLEKLTEWSGFEKAFLLSSGTEATEAALKIMRAYGKKAGKGRVVVCLEGAFHGKTLGAQMMSGKSDFHDPDIRHIALPPVGEPDGLYYFLQRSLGELCNSGVDPDNDICGFMLETFRAWDAYFYPPRFVQAIQISCRQRNTLLCFDEMQSGFARTGRKFGYEHYGVKPDLICVGKGMGGGVPLSGILGRAELLDLPDDLSSTHSGNPLACAAGAAVLEEIERLDLVAESARKGQILLRELGKLTELFPEPVQYVSGEGMIWAVVFKDADFAARVAEKCMQNGLLVVYTARESIKIGPPLVIPDDALLEGAHVIAEAVAAIAAG